MKRSAKTGEKEREKEEEKERGGKHTVEVVPKVYLLTQPLKS